jgi:D-amino-acid dehydrogenase
VRLIVVGSGIVGSSCAYTASGLGAEVTLVDSAQPGRATSAGAGIISPWSSRTGDDLWYSFACKAGREYGPLVDGLAELGETEVGYRQVGALVLADTEEQQEQAWQHLVARQSQAPEVGEVEAITGAQAQRLFPPLRPSGFAVFTSGAARIDGRLLAAALGRAAVSRGAVIRQGHADLQCRSGQVTGVLIDGELVAADAVVAAAGAWTRALLQPAGVTVPVTAQRGQIAHVSMRPADTSRWPVILPGGSGHYLLAFDGSRVVAGATRETVSGFDFRVTPGGLAEVLQQALAVAPGLASGTYLETRVGFRPMSPDGRPLLGPVAGLDGLVVATGLGSDGLTIGPYAGALAARIALGVPAGTDLAPFDPVRAPATQAPG